MTIVSRNSPPFDERGAATVYIGETVNAGFRLQQPDGSGGWTLQSYTGRVFGLRVYGDGGTTLVNVLGTLTSHADGAYIACNIPGTTTDDLAVGLYGWEFVEFVSDGRLVISGGTFKVATASAAAQASGSSGTSSAGSTVYTLRTDLGIVTVNYSGAPGGGIPAGGTAGQYPRKSSSTDYDIAWDTITSADISGLDAQLAALQSADTDLGVFAALTPADDDLLQRKAGAWANRTPAQVKTDLALSIADVASLQTALDAKASLAGATMAGVLAFVAGTAALPGLAVAGDLNTGIYGVSADVLGFTTGGTARVTISASGLMPFADATYDLGAASTRFYAGLFSNSVKIGGAAPAGAASLSSIQSFGSNWSLIGGDVLTDATTKFTRLGVLHYLAAEEPVVTLSASSSVSSNTVQVGGGTGFGNAATNISFWTAANTTTLTGTQRWQIDSTGAFFPGADNTYDFGWTGGRIRSGYFGTNVVIGYSTTSTAQLHVGAGAVLTIPNGIGTGTAPQVTNAQTSGVAIVSAAVHDGANNRRAGLFVDNTNGLWGLSSAASSGVAPFIIWQNGAEQLRLTTGGNLGIGDAAPYSRAVISATAAGAAANCLVLVNNTPYGAGVGLPTARLTFNHNSGSAAASGEMAYVDGGNTTEDTASNGYLALGTRRAGTLTEAVRITSAGYVGVGTAAPTSFLHVAGATGATLNTTYEPSGWLGLKHRTGVQYSGDTLVSSVNVRLTSLSAGTLDDATNTGAALVLTAGGRLTLVNATAGSGSRTFSPLFDVSTAGVATLYNNLLFGADNSFDVGAAGANRARTIYAGTSFVGPDGTAAAPTFAFAGSVSTGMYRDSGGNRIRFTRAGTYTGVNIGAGVVGISSDTGQFELGSAQDVVWVREAAGTSALRNGANAQAFRIYNTTDGTNLERLSVAFSGNVAYIITQQAGTGVVRNMVLGTQGAATVELLTNNVSRWTWTSGGTYQPSADATYSIGSASAQVLDIFASRYLKIGGAAPAGAAGLATIQAFGNGFGLIGADVLTDATAKSMRIAVAHYTNTEEPMAYMTGGSTAAGGSVAIGGGTSGANAVMQINFYTAANNTTTTGTNRWQIDEAGHFFPIASATYNIGYTGSRVLNVYAANLDVSRTIDGTAGMTAVNASVGASARTGLQLTNDGGSTAFVALHGSGTGAGIGRPNAMVVQGPYAVGVAIHASHASGIIEFVTGGTGSGNTRWKIDASGHLLGNADNTYDIGASGASRPRDLNVGRNITTGGSITSGSSVVATTSITAGASNSINWSGRSVMSSTADGRIMLTNAAGDSFSRIMLGGSTTSYPAIGRVTTNIVVTLGDGTMGAGLVAAFVQTPAATVAALPAAATAGAGARAFVTDATATTFLSTVAGGGANAVPVVSNGTNWLIG